MSTEAKNVRLDAVVFDALQEAATREHKTLDEMASEAVIAGLNADRLSRVQAVLAKGHKHGAASGISEDEIVDVIHASRAKHKLTR